MTIKNRTIFTIYILLYPNDIITLMLRRLTASNGEITITTSHNANAGPASSAGSAGSGPIPSPHAPVKMSPGSVKSPSHDDSDLLADSPSKFPIVHYYLSRFYCYVVLSSV